MKHILKTKPWYWWVGSTVSTALVGGGFLYFFLALAYVMEG